MLIRTRLLASSLLFCVACNSRDNRADSLVPTSDSVIKTVGVESSSTKRALTALDWNTCDDGRRPDSVARPQEHRAVEFLDTMRAGTSDTGSLRIAHFASADQLLSYVSDSGLTFVDVNGFGKDPGTADTVIHVSKAELRHELIAKRGAVFERLVHMADRAALPRARSDMQTYCPSATGVVISTPYGYTATFQLQNGELRLTWLAYVLLESD